MAGNEKGMGLRLQAPPMARAKFFIPNERQIAIAHCLAAYGVSHVFASASSGGVFQGTRGKAQSSVFPIFAYLEIP